MFLERSIPNVELISRLAPSPTGCLHAGNARSFLLAWLQARAHGGQILLRIEDLDLDRAVSGAEAEIVRDLRWLGLDWDNELTPEYYQSNRFDLYREALAVLEKHDLLYPCYCSRKELREAMSAPHNPGNRYSGTCRHLTRAEQEKRAVQKDPALRFKVQPNSAVKFDDLVAGEVCVDVFQDTGDFIVARADGVPSYQLAVVLDDIAMGVTHVLRGNDLLDSTPRQLLLYRAFGEVPPAYAHVPLILNPEGVRLAKRSGAVAISEMRRKGYSPETVVGWLAWSCGLCSTPAPIKASELISGFAIEKLPSVPTALPFYPP